MDSAVHCFSIRYGFPQNYFGCVFALPIVISSMRWGVAAGRKTMVCTHLFPPY